MTKDWHRNADESHNTEPKYPNTFDTIIIGAGPAGMTAAIYAARRKMKALMICGKVGGQMNWCNDISNWTGVAQSTGPGLKDQFFSHVQKVDQDNAHFDLWLKEDRKVINITKVGTDFFVATNNESVFRAKTIICTVGKVPRVLNIPGEDIAMRGNGLSFSATQDAPLYRGKKMVIIGGGNSAMDVALQLEKYTQDITIMTNLDHLIGEATLMEKVNTSPHIQIKYEIDMKEIRLDQKQKVRAVRFTQAGSQTQELDCKGIFEEVGHIPATQFLNDFVTLNKHGEIITDRLMKSSVSGFFAAGDCNDGYHKQVIVAAGEGAIAALQAHQYLLEN